MKQFLKAIISEQFRVPNVDATQHTPTKEYHRLYVVRRRPQQTSISHRSVSVPLMRMRCAVIGLSPIPRRTRGGGGVLDGRTDTHMRIPLPPPCRPERKHNHLPRWAVQTAKETRGEPERDRESVIEGRGFFCVCVCCVKMRTQSANLLAGLRAPIVWHTHTHIRSLFGKHLPLSLSACPQLSLCRRRRRICGLAGNKSNVLQSRTDAHARTFVFGFGHLRSDASGHSPQPLQSTPTPP